MWRCGDKWENEYAPDKGATTHPRVERSLVWIVDVSSELMSSGCILTPCEGDVLPPQPCALASNVKITQSQSWYAGYWRQRLMLKHFELRAYKVPGATPSAAPARARGFVGALGTRLTVLGELRRYPVIFNRHLDQRIVGDRP